MYHISIPHADGVLDTDFPHEQAIHPPKAELNKFHSLGLEMLRQPSIDPRREIPQTRHLSLYPRLRKNIVILNAIQKFRQTPKRICLYRIQDGFWKLPGIHAEFYLGICDVGSEEDLPEGCHEIVYALYVTASGVAYCPHVEDALQASLRGLVTVELEMWVCSWDIDADLMPYCFVQASPSATVCAGSCCCACNTAGHGIAAA